MRSIGQGNHSNYITIDKMTIYSEEDVKQFIELYRRSFCKTLTVSEAKNYLDNFLKVLEIARDID